MNQMILKEHDSICPHRNYSRGNHVKQNILFTCKFLSSEDLLTNCDHDSVLFSIDKSENSFWETVLNLLTCA